MLNSLAKIIKIKLMENTYHFKKETIGFINAIESFFAMGSISSSLQFLKNWLNPPQNECEFSPQKHPAQLVRFYEKLLPLFEYADLIFNHNEADTAFVKAITADENSLERESVLLDYCPKMLSKGEMQNPKLTFLEMFLFFQSPGYKASYNEWLLAGLENTLDQEWDGNIYPLYGNTKKMLEACWLIHERIITKNSFKSIDRYYHLAVFESTSPLAFDKTLFENPFAVIESFFALDNLAGHKSYLKNWYKIALSKASHVSNSSDYFFLYNQFTQLINAGYLIAAKKLVYQATVDETDDAANAAFQAQLCEVNTLSPVHVKNPYLFIETFFVPEKIRQLRTGLLEWLHAAFSTKSSIKLMDKEYLFEQYENMLMIIEAFFLVINDPSLGKEEEENWIYLE